MSDQPPRRPGQIPNECIIRYHRRGELVRFTLTSATNHEIREVLVGLWSRLEEADRVDHLRELTHYLEPDSRLSDVARAIAEGPEGETAIDLRAIAAARVARPGRRRKGRS